jgi:hypothetical protein
MLARIFNSAPILSRTAAAIPLFAMLALGTAQADTLQISGTAFVRHCPCDFDLAADNALVENGILKPQATNTRYYAAVVFPRDGEQVCRFSLVYVDTNAQDSMFVRLLKKVGNTNGNPDNAPIVMATLKSSISIADKIRVATTNVINSPQIDNALGFYYVEAEVPTVNLEILGVRIEVAPTCS